MALTQEEYKPKLNALIADINSKFIERDELARILVLTVFSKQHIFLIGEPGVGKTDITSTIASMIRNTTFWEKVVDYDTKKHELFGDASIPYLELDKSETILGNHFVFLDEMFKAPSEPLNACLPVMNERVFQDKGKKHKVDLLSMFGASNEMPHGEKIAPFDDRLIFRYDVLRIQKPENFIRFAKKDFDTSRVLNVQFDIEDLDFVGAQSKLLNVDDFFFTEFNNLKMKIVQSSIKVSDRKFGRAIDILRVSAFLNNRQTMDYSDFFILNHIAWSKIEEKKRIKKITYEYCFSSKDEIDAVLIGGQKEFKKLEGEMQEQLADFLNYNFSQDDFGQVLEFKFNVLVDTTTDSFLKQIEKICEPFFKIQERKKFADMVAEQISNNIFVPDVKDRTFTVDIVSQYEGTVSNLGRVYEKIKQWSEDNKDYFSFQQHCLLNSKRS